MNSFLQRMREELVRRNYAQSTMRSYLRIVRDFQVYCGKRLDRLGPDDLRSYHAYLLEERKLAVRTVVQHVAAIRFLYTKTLKRRDMKEDLPYPRNYQRRLPVVLSPEEAMLLIDSARNLFHRAMLMTLYSCGLRRAELCRLKVSDIDSKRMMIRILQGKGNVDREVPLSPKLLDTAAVLALDETKDVLVSRHGKGLASRQADHVEDGLGSGSVCGHAREVTKACDTAHVAAQLRHASARSRH